MSHNFYGQLIMQYKKFINLDKICLLLELVSKDYQIFTIIILLVLVSWLVVTLAQLIVYKASDVIIDQWMRSSFLQTELSRDICNNACLEWTCVIKWVVEDG